MKGRAGEYWNSFREDVRFETFWKTVSIRACEKIAEIAISAADRIHRSTAGDLPTADALLTLSNTSLAYSTAARESVAPAPQTKEQPKVQQTVGTQQMAAGTTVQQADQPHQATVEPQQVHQAQRPEGPPPYASQAEAVQATHEIVRHFRAWCETPMGQELVHGDHPRLVAFRDAWKELPPADMPNGPGPAAAPYGNVAASARSLWREAAASGRFADADLTVLRAIADTARAHSQRLGATAPPVGGAATAAPSRQAAATMPTAAQQAPPRPRAATAPPPAPASSPRISA
ncbi:hypothetical protein J1792_32305 [Streptomyces triculaminicus]|uniref:Uncharacterized protein n=1 Tax=Streptomyces triculaminicus TaxID=2816232 RepID=A0A939FUV1_9ACTN|nr:hypothetical protein [Streptomyces triculaminicus]MBO0657229.1 hypothetical protein [Streptomyces triculaminicus]